MKLERKGINRVVTCLLVLVFSQAKAQNENLSVYPDWKYYDNMSNILYKQLCEAAFEQLDQRETRIEGLKENSHYRSYQNEITKTLKTIIGEFPDKTPLNPVITGVLQKEDYRVEKLYFESFPQYYVSAALFVPEGVKGKMPAILFCSGHNKESFRGTTYQHNILNLVKKGFVVLAFDPIGQGERIQYLDSQEEGIFSATQEHSYPGTQSFLSGRSPAFYFIWDGIRALDYLATRDDIVDMERIGITGRSGGGTQSTFIAAMDKRVAASVTESYITSYDKLLRSVGPTDAEQTLLYALRNKLDFPDFLIARAPKPTMILSTTRDFFSIQGAKDTYSQTKKFYQVYGQPENLSFVVDDAAHASTRKNREAAYGFFQKHLKNPGSMTDLEVDLIDQDALQVTQEGSVFKSLGSKTMYELNKDFTRNRQVGKLVKWDAPAYRDSIKNQVLSLSGYLSHETNGESIFAGRSFRGTYSIEKYLVKGSGNYFIPVLWFRPFESTKKVILLLDEQGKEKAAEQKGLADQLVREGYEVVLPDLIGIGELGGGFNRGSAFIQNTPLNVWYLGVLTKKTVASLRMEEIKLLNDFIVDQNNNKSEIAAIGTGSLCMDLLHLNAVEPVFEEIVLLEPLASFKSLVEERDYKTKYVMSAVPGGLIKYEIIDLYKLAAPTAKVLTINPVRGNGSIKEVETMEDSFATLLNGRGIPGNQLKYVNHEVYFGHVQDFLE